MKKIEEQVTELIEKNVNGLGYELYDVEYGKRGKDYYLTVYIDSQKGISLTDCENVTNAINDILDDADYIKEQYFLEVSSPGLERMLKNDKHYNSSIGKEIEIKLYTKVNDNKQYQGILKQVLDEDIILEIENKEIIFKRNNIAQAKTKYNWQGN